MIKVVLWDIDNTLLDFIAAERAAIRKCFSIFDMGECTDEMLAAYSAVNVRWWERLERGERTKPEILLGRFREFFSMYGRDPALAEAFNAEYQVRLGDTVVFFPGAKETVEALKGRTLQCGVTNGTRIAQERKLANSGLDRLLDKVFISEDVGYEKPDRRYFDAVFAAIGDYAREEIMIVGDSLTSDMPGGVNAGIVTCWFNPRGKTNGTELRIDYEIRAIPEVLEILGKERDG